MKLAHVGLLSAVLAFGVLVGVGDVWVAERALADASRSHEEHIIGLFSASIAARLSAIDDIILFGARIEIANVVFAGTRLISDEDRPAFEANATVSGNLLYGTSSTYHIRSPGGGRMETEPFYRPIVDDVPFEYYLADVQHLGRTSAVIWNGAHDGGEGVIIMTSIWSNTVAIVYLGEIISATARSAGFYASLRANGGNSFEYRDQTISFDISPFERIDSTDAPSLVYYGVFVSCAIVMMGFVGYAQWRFLARRNEKQERLIAFEFTQALQYIVRSLSAPAQSLFFSANLIGMDTDHRMYPMYAEINNIKDIVDNYYDITALDLPGAVSNQDDVDVTELVSDVVRQYSASAFVAEVDLVNGSTEGEIRIKSDKERLKHILCAGIRTAIRYSPQHGKVIVTVRRLSDTVVVDIKDESSLTVVLHGSFRASTDGGEGHRGMVPLLFGNHCEVGGMAILIGKELAKRLGGKLQYKNRDDEGGGQGVHFCLTLPST